MSIQRRDIQRLLDEIEDLPGWRVRRYDTSGKHCTIFPPDGQKIIMVPCTPGGWRWRLNLRAELRRAGWIGTSLG